jgi:hypothetical protein
MIKIISHKRNNQIHIFQTNLILIVENQNNQFKTNRYPKSKILNQNQTVIYNKYKVPNLPSKYSN